MALPYALLTLAIAAFSSLAFSTFTYALRDLSRVRLGDYLQRHNRSQWLDKIVDHTGDLIFITAVLRMLANTLIVLALVWVCQPVRHAAARDLTIFLSAAVVTVFFSVAIPHALAKYAGDEIVGASAPVLHAMRIGLLPVTWIMRLADQFVRSAAGASAAPRPEQGEEQGVVDEHEREMIESVIEFHDATAAQVMTARTDVVSLPLASSLHQVKQMIEESGHSRIPIYEGTLDQIVGILYARDMLKFVGQPPDKFDLRSAMRPAFFVPESKPLSDLLHDFRQQKVHIAIVLDEYGGTAGLVTIEDILEQLVGEISDEHEPIEPGTFRRLDARTVEADARIDIEEFNRLTGLNLPEDAGYATLGGFILATLGRIPEAGASFEYNGAKFTVLDAEPQRVNRVRIEQIPQPAEEPAPQPTGQR
jgi:CBS domain containing-hemolysin-like protein